MSRLLSMLLALAIACAPWPAYAATPATVRLEVDVSALPAGDVTERLEAYLVEEQTRTIVDGGLELADDSSNAIRVSISRYGEDDVHYRATIALLQGTSEAAVVERTITCELCRDGELVSRVAEEVARLSGRVLYGPEEQSDADHPQAQDPPQPEPETSATEGNDEKTRKVGPLGVAGIASLVVGVGATGGGIPLAVAPDQTRPAASGVERRTTRPAGLALVGVGTALIVTGAVLVTVDALRRKKARQVSFFPAVTPSSVTVSMSMRFGS